MDQRDRSETPAEINLLRQFTWQPNDQFVRAFASAVLGATMIVNSQHSKLVVIGSGNDKRHRRSGAQP
jgi:hypothetical protein